jgi:hypothetical protein
VLPSTLTAQPTVLCTRRCRIVQWAMELARNYEQKATCVARYGLAARPRVLGTEDGSLFAKTLQRSNNKPVERSRRPQPLAN